MANPASRFSRSRIAILLLSGAVPITVAYYMTRPDPGLSQLQKSRDAIHQATSWHSHESMLGPAAVILREETRDVFCPSRTRSNYRIETSFITPDRLRDGDAQRSRIEMSIDGVHYSQIDGGPWTSHPEGMFLQDCGGAPIVLGSKLYFDADIIIPHGQMKYVGERHVGADACTDWEASWDRIKPRYTICINEADHLPRRIAREDGWTIEFSNWNQPSSLVAPI
jgi:hypothetical protein